jgi:probable F420-dependent oxidoreductase
LRAVTIGRVGVWAFLDAAPAPLVAEIAAELDELGYGAIWVPETVGRDPFLLCSQLLAASPRISAATGIASIYARGPLAMASAWKTLGEAFPSRFLLGLGVSHAPMVEGVHRQSYTAPVSTMRRFLDAMDAAFYTAPLPDPMPPRVLAALGPKMLALAAERTDGAHPYLVTPEHTAVARAALGDGPVLAPEQTVVLATDRDVARGVAREFARAYLQLPNYANNLLRLGYTQEELDDGADRVIDAIVAWGDVDAIRARVRAHHDAGADHVCVQVLPHERGELPRRAWRELAPALLSA